MLMVPIWERMVRTYCSNIRHMKGNDDSLMLQAEWIMVKEMWKN